MLVQRIQELISQSSKNYVFIWIPSHEGIDKNEIVDSMAKSSFNEPLSTQFKPNKFDIRKTIVPTIKKNWDDDWKMITMDNKLRNLKNNVLPWKTINLVSRKESVILTRLRTGHSLLTHSYLMNSSPRLSAGVEHI